MKDLTTITVNGVSIAVEARARAKYTKENRPNALTPIGTVVETVDELLLTDGTVLYQCVHPQDENCTFTHSNLRSVTAHQTAHGKRRIEREAREAQAAAAAARAELAERIQRRSNGSRQAAQTRRQQREDAERITSKIDMVPVELGGRGGSGPKGRGKPTGDVELAKMGQRVITAYNTMQDAADEFQRVLIGYLRAAQVASDCQPAEAPPIDPVILEKARRWDAMQELMGK